MGQITKYWPSIGFLFNLKPNFKIYTHSLVSRLVVEFTQPPVKMSTEAFLRVKTVVHRVNSAVAVVPYIHMPMVHHDLEWGHFYLQT